MNEEELESERKLSRELGAIDSRLSNIEKMIWENQSSMRALWDKFDACKDSHSISDRDIIKKLYATTGGIAVFVTVAGYIIEKIIK